MKKKFQFFLKFKKILKSENFSQKIHVYEFFPQNQKFFQLNTEVQPVKKYVLRKQKNFQTDLNLHFFAVTAKRNKNKISRKTSLKFPAACQFLRKSLSLFVSNFFIFHPNDFKLWHLHFE